MVGDGTLFPSPSNPKIFQSRKAITKGKNHSFFLLSHFQNITRLMFSLSTDLGDGPKQPITTEKVKNIRQWGYAVYDFDIRQRRANERTIGN